jgi:hypothetical protein
VEAQRAQAQDVAAEQQFLLRAVPERECKLAHEPIGGIASPFEQRFEQDRRVGVARVPGGTQSKTGDKILVGFPDGEQKLFKKAFAQ